MQNEEQIFLTTLIMGHELDHELAVAASCVCVLRGNKPSPKIGIKGALGRGVAISKLGWQLT